MVVETGVYVWFRQFNRQGIKRWSDDGIRPTPQHKLSLFTLKEGFILSPLRFLSHCHLSDYDTQGGFIFPPETQNKRWPNTRCTATNISFFLHSVYFLSRGHSSKSVHFGFWLRKLVGHKKVLPLEKCQFFYPRGGEGGCGKRPRFVSRSRAMVVPLVTAAFPPPPAAAEETL